MKTTVLPDMSDAKSRREKERVPEPRRAAGHRAPEGEEDTVESAPAGQATGRHTVPDELVKASTYRLPPDRVFRAKVRDSVPSGDDPTTKLVPKPRES